MTKQEYLERLRTALAERVPELQQEVMEDYEIHFEMGMKAGKSEEQICEELGDIDEFVAELVQIESAEKKVGAEKDTEPKEEEPEHCEGKVEGGNTGSGINWSEAIANLQNTVQEFIDQPAVKDLIHQSEEALYKGSAIIQDKVREYFKGPAFEGSQAYTAENATEEDQKGEVEESRSSDTLKNLVLEGLSADVLVEASEDDSIHIHYENLGSMKQCMQYRFYFREEGDTIYAGVRKSRTSAGIFWGTFSPEMKLTVKLPTTAQMIELNTLSGSVNMKNVQAGEFRVTTASGDIKLYRIQADAMRASAMSGSIQADQLNVKCLEVQSKSGDVRADDMTGEALLLKSMSGDVKISHVDCKELSVSSISGDATGRSIRAEQMACTSTSGDAEIQGEFQRCRVESVSGDATLTTGKDLEASVSSVSGDVRLNLSNEGRGFELNYQTVSGELEVRYGGEHQYLTRNGRLEKGERGSRVHLKTVSGDMVISD